MQDTAAFRMDRMYRFQRHIYDATRRHYLLGRKTLVNGLVPPENGTILEIGCGTAWNTIEAARSYPDATLFGFDISDMMLATAGKNVLRSGLGGRVRLARGDATSVATQDVFGIAHFDRVFASYILSMIPEWERALEHATTLVAPGGSLHIIDFGPGHGLPTPFRAALRSWLRRFDVTPRDGLRREIERLARQRGLEAFYSELHGGYAQYAVLTRYCIEG